MTTYLCISINNEHHSESILPMDAQEKINNFFGGDVYGEEFDAPMLLLKELSASLGIDDVLHHRWGRNILVAMKCKECCADVKMMMY